MGEEGNSVGNGLSGLGSKQCDRELGGGTSPLQQDGASTATANPPTIEATHLGIISDTHLRLSAPSNEPPLRATVKEMLSLPPVKAASQQCAEKLEVLIETIDALFAPERYVRLKESMVNIMKATRISHIPRDDHDHPVEGFDLAGKGLDDDAPEIFRALKDRWIHVRVARNQTDSLWQSVNSMLLAWEFFRYWQETKRRYHSEDEEYAEERAYIQRIITDSGARPRGRKTEDELKRAIAPLLGIHSINEDHRWKHTVNMGRHVATLEQRWGLFPLVTKSQYV